MFWVGEMAWAGPDGALARLTDEDLPGAASPPESGELATRLFCVLHALTHHAHHNGQLLLFRLLWQARG